jgi:hypothetical protein
MLYIKYNSLASYTKQIDKYFDTYITKNNIKQTSTYTRKKFIQEKNDGINVENFKNLYFKDFLNSITKNQNSFYFLENIDDIPLLFDSPLKNIIKILENINYNGICIFFVLPNIKSRLTSLYTRDKNKYTNINDILQNTHKIHMESFNSNIVAKFITYEYVILFSEFEFLLNLHLNNKIKLFCIQDTCIQNPRKILSGLGLDISNLDFVNIETHRIKKSVTIDKLKALNEFMNEHISVIEDRYSEILSKCKENNVTIIE